MGLTGICTETFAALFFCLCSVFKFHKLNSFKFKSTLSVPSAISFFFTPKTSREDYQCNTCAPSGGKSRNYDTENIDKTSVNYILDKTIQTRRDNCPTGCVFH